jgi:steroid delta-isomerase-like uncharacterized protein
MNPVEPNKKIAIRLFEEVWNQGRVELIHEFVHPGAITYDLEGPGVVTNSFDAFRTFHSQMRGAIPDLKITILDVIAENDKVVLRTHSHGTHLGPDLGMPPTGNAVDFAAVVILRFENGRIAESWNFLDQLSFYQQLRVLNVR